MQIKIAERLHPFSHQSATFCLIPYTTWEVQIFPTRLYFRHLIHSKDFDLRLSFKGPIKNFTLEQDLEHGVIRVFGESLEGYIEYLIVKDTLQFKKLPIAGILCGNTTVHKGMVYPLPIEAFTLAESKERLSLGMHRSQDWDNVKRRLDLKEIFPAWLRLAALIPEEKTKPIPNEGTLTLLNQCKQAIESEDKTELCTLFTQLFQAGLQGILAPRLTDENFLGIAPEGKTSGFPLILLHEGAHLIKSLFFKEEQDTVYILPLLPPEFHSGRLLLGEEIAIEWSKKLIKKIIWKSPIDREIRLNLQRPIQSFRLRHSMRDHGKKIFKDESFILKAGKTVFLDQFKK
ncbi:MAG TPA: hypothetical protein VLF61_02375 [Rhabdochlamydiaceae bacterium]|nr:hypothetical protein [Rhabdochlamydiaceae bacterium]